MLRKITRDGVEMSRCLLFAEGMKDARRLQTIEKDCVIAHRNCKWNSRSRLNCLHMSLRSSIAVHVVHSEPFFSVHSLS